MIHFVCFPKEKIETFANLDSKKVSVSKIKTPKNSKEAIDIFKNKINNVNNKFKGHNIIKLNKKGNLIIDYQKKLINIKKNIENTKARSATINSSSRKPTPKSGSTKSTSKTSSTKSTKSGSTKSTSKTTSSKSGNKTKDKKNSKKETFENIKQESELLKIKQEMELLKIKQEINISKDKVPHLFSRSVQNFGEIGSIDISKLYDLIYRTFYLNDKATTFDKNKFITDFINITTSIENRLDKGFESLTDLGFNYLAISPVLTSKDYDVSGNYTYKYVPSSA